MSNTDNTQAENGIHYFTCSEGRKWADFSASFVTADSDMTAMVIACSPPWEAAPDGLDMDGFAEFELAGQVGGKNSLMVRADRIEVVTEYVEATVMDALQALVASWGKPVEGWKFSDDGDITESIPLSSVDVSDTYRFGTKAECFKNAFRPVTRVRIKPEVITAKKAYGKMEIPADMPWLAYIGKVRIPASAIIPPISPCEGFGIYNWDGTWHEGSDGSGHCWHYAVDVRNEHIRKHFPKVCKAHDYSRVYGYTLDGNPVPPPPEGWEIVPEGEIVKRGDHAYGNVRAWGIEAAEGRIGNPAVASAIRAYARRVVTAPATAEESSVVGELERAFDKHWHGGSKHRAIDAFRAGAAWAKEVRGE